MNCWDILGLERTRDRNEIERAYQQQRKFAAGDEQERLDQAYREALSEAGLDAPASGRESGSRSPGQPAPSDDDAGQSLSAREHQIARETVVQVNALLNDPGRSKDVNIWRAILAEAPADQPHIRQRIGESLESQLRPMAENGAFPADVTLFLGDWFGWDGAARKAHRIAEENDSEQPEQRDGEAAESMGKPQMVQFWPAILGWIVGLILLTSLFSNLAGG
ncbi:MAG: J domain-containing protein [Marinobacter sp.]|uniref:J domain-containing protein n=1 Tax=Marinobacter sp. TaxID=50741 RepID=UPI00299D5311|nr:J domain-containing protein [Marinobacter sp.]MDX1634555.1 J domain-containing protein [Marinobacter sp.]